MSRAAIIALFVGSLVGAGLLAGLISGRPWTRWLSLALVSAFFLVLDLMHPSKLLVALPIVILVGALGFGAGEAGRRLRAILVRR